MPSTSAPAASPRACSTDGLRGRTTSLTFGLQGIAQLVGTALAGPAAALLGPLAVNAEALAHLATGALALRTALRARRPGAPVSGRPRGPVGGCR